MERAPQVFRDGAGSSAQVICAICLGKHPISEVSACNRPTLWNGRPAFSMRIGRRIQSNEGAPICISWQRPSGCSSGDHPERHICSGCGRADHGAFECTLAQTE
ncbi:hypothetical protein C2E23DRAFT_728308 [Lenzites betulinus]|nr:hypothetical protein C2E23DRAFT_728308 [Lenzites betulinus]